MLPLFLRTTAALLLTCLTCPAFPQTQPAPTFIAADVHPSPSRSYPFFFGVTLPQDRYVLRDATLIDLISTAFGLDPDNVQGGPSWVERDRFDVLARLPSHASNSDQRLMLRALVADRFHLTLHSGAALLPAFILSAPKSKLNPAAGIGEPICDDAGQPQAAPGAVRQIHVVCRNFSMDAFANQLHDMAGGYLNKPVVNSTHLDGAFDFDLKWTSRGDLQKAGADGISIFDAVDKQLGLKLTLETAPRPVVLIDAALRQPTPNPSGLDKLLPPPTLPQFEVATIKPSKPGTQPGGRISGTDVNFRSITLRDMIDLAWDLNQGDPNNILNAPKWLAEDRFDILAKVSPDSTGTSVSAAGGLPMDIYEVQDMLRALLIERFQIKAHLEDHPIDAYTLTAVKPHLRPADPTLRTVCKEEPAPGEKDPRLLNPELNRLVSCRNMTMAEICGELDQIANGYIFSPVLDATNIKGSFDFTLSFSSANRVPNAANPSTTPGIETAPDPNGALSLFDAVNRQLGLKLVKQRRSLPVLVIDHIEEKPTEN